MTEEPLKRKQHDINPVAIHKCTILAEGSELVQSELRSPLLNVCFFLYGQNRLHFPKFHSMGPRFGCFMLAAANVASSTELRKSGRLSSFKLHPLDFWSWWKCGFCQQLWLWSAPQLTSCLISWRSRRSTDDASMNQWSSGCRAPTLKWKCVLFGISTVYLTKGQPVNSGGRMSVCRKIVGNHKPKRSRAHSCVVWNCQVA